MRLGRGTTDNEDVEARQLLNDTQNARDICLVVGLAAGKISKKADVSAKRTHHHVFLETMDTRSILDQVGPVTVRRRTRDPGSLDVSVASSVGAHTRQWIVQEDEVTGVDREEEDPERQVREIVTHWDREECYGQAPSPHVFAGCFVMEDRRGPGAASS